MVGNKKVIVVMPAYNAAKTLEKGSGQFARGGKEKPEQKVQARPKTAAGKKVGRNDPCPCGAKKEDGSPKKYKHCCGRDA